MKQKKSEGKVSRYIDQRNKGDIVKYWQGCGATDQDLWSDKNQDYIMMYLRI